MSQATEYFINTHYTDNKKIICLPVYMIEDYDIWMPKEIVEQPHIVISIRSPFVEKADLPEVDNRKDTLFLEVADVNSQLKKELLQEVNNNEEKLLSEFKMTKEHFFSLNHAKEVCDFLEKNNDVKIILVNCEAGVSRSAGLSKALEEYFNPETIKEFGNKFDDTSRYLPNDLFYIYTKQELEERFG